MFITSNDVNRNKGEKKMPAHSREEGSTRPWDVKHIRDRHYSLMRELVAGATYAQAAARTGFSAGRVATLVSTPLFKQELQNLRDKVNDEFAITEASTMGADKYDKRIEGEVMKSLETLCELRDSSTSDSVRRKSAADLLDRAGYKTTEEQTHHVTLEATVGLLEVLSDGLSSGRIDAKKFFNSPSPDTEKEHESEPDPEKVKPQPDEVEGY